MRQWRVGTISLGIILLGCGAALLSWSLGGQPLPVLYLRWWPIALIILGLEIIASALPQRDNQPAFKYDGASILLIVIILIGSLGLSLLNGLGLLERLAAVYRL